MKIGTRDGMLIAALEENLKHLVMKRFAVSLFLVATALSVSNCGSSASLISGDQMLILGTPYPNDHSFHRAIATEIEDGFKVASDIKNKVVDFGIVICFTGIGMSMIANKVKGVRCALVHNKDAAKLTREHNDSNCLALSAKYTGPVYANEIVDVWLETKFSENERHARRIAKIAKYEEEF